MTFGLLATVAQTSCTAAIRRGGFPAAQPPLPLAAMRVDIQIATGSRTAPAARDLRRWAQQALQGEAGGVCVRIVDACEGELLNGKYRGAAAATNVLSFPSGVEIPGEVRTTPVSKYLGDVVICAPVVEAEAREQRKPAAHHYAHMVVHGILHLRGFDHETDEQAREMEHLEARILADIGIADPYAA